MKNEYMIDKNNQNNSDMSELPIDSDGLVVFDETRVKKRRDGPTFDVIIKNWYNKYIKSKED